jgi:hypothetical protein
VIDLDRAQERVAEMLTRPGAESDEALRLLAGELGLAISAP